MLHPLIGFIKTLFVPGGWMPCGEKITRVLSGSIIVTGWGGIANTFPAIERNGCLHRNLYRIITLVYVVTGLWMCTLKDISKITFHSSLFMVHQIVKLGRQKRWLCWGISDRSTEFNFVNGFFSFLWTFKNYPAFRNLLLSELHSDSSNNRVCDYLHRRVKITFCSYNRF